MWLARNKRGKIKIDDCFGIEVSKNGFLFVPSELFDFLHKKNITTAQKFLELVQNPSKEFLDFINCEEEESLWAAKNLKEKIGE